MNFEQERRVTELLGEAFELPSAERSLFVRRAAADDPEVVAEVLRRLDHSPSTGWMPTGGGADTSRANGPTFTSGDLVGGRYRVKRFISAGGMGEVYEVWDEALRQRIALKTILPAIEANPRVLERFRREAAAAREVTHPNVCRVFDVGEHRRGDGEPNSETAFLTMEFLDGETLAERLKSRGPMTPGEALPLLRQMAQGLTAAHRSGVVHRDFKPGNVMLVPSSAGERAVVTDFGLARSVEPPATPEHGAAQTDLTATGAVVGTVKYMAPEQLAGEATGPAADVYAFGVVMHEMLTGRTPVWPRPSGFQLHPAWERVIGACLAEKPDARPASPADAISALDMPSSNPGMVPSQRRSRLWAVAVALFLVLCAALLFWISRLSVRDPGPAGATTSVAVLAFRAGEPDLQIFADGLMDVIAQRLAQYEDANRALLVAPASEVRRANVVSATDARTKLGANLVVEGTLHAQQDRLRLTMSVIDTSTMRQVNSAIVEGKRSMALSVQDEAVLKLVRALDLRVRPDLAADLNRVNPLSPGAYEFFLQAKGYLQRNDRLTDIDSAIELLNRAISLDPSNAAAFASLGEAYWYRYERTSDITLVAKARQACDTALRLDPRQPQVHVTLGRLLVGTGRHQEAIPEFDKALSLDPRNSDAYQALGRAYQNSGDLARAESTLRKAIELRSTDWRAYRELGLFFYRQSDYRRAIEQFERVVQLTPDNASAYNNLGGFYGIVGDKVKARQMLERALALEPTRVSALTNLTKILFDEGRTNEAISRWQAAVERDPSSHRLWGNLGAAQTKGGRLETARASFGKGIQLLTEAIAVNPSGRELYSYRAHYYSAIGLTKEALADLRRTGTPAGGDVEMLVRDALTFVEVGRPADARLRLEAALGKGYPRSEALKNQKLRQLVSEKQTRSR
ncbi:MAG: tetratricopeptide repeat protein [Bryobacterales bacterium]|nr:tetratricopeptide repeat protein [Bryobacterales bacterium]